MPKKASLALCIAVAGLFFAGCAGRSFLPKDSVDLKTTALFMKPCKDLENIKKAEEKNQETGKKGFWAKINPASLVKQEPEEQKEKIENSVNDCHTVDIERMDAALKSIQERNEEKGIPGDTLSDVRRKGFSIFMDENEKIRRPNTEQLYGNDALACAGLSVSPPPLQKPDEIKVYTEFMIQHYCEKYYEKNVKITSDRLCINNDESLEIGYDKKYAILWRNGHVIKVVEQGGPVNNPKKSSAFFLCPGGFVGDTIKGTLGGAAKIKGF